MKLGEWKIMKLFKKALIATAVVSAFGAQAVTVSSDKLQISKQGIEAGNAATIATAATQAFVLDFVVDKLTPAASTITLTFSEGVDLSYLDVGSSDVNNVVGSGTGIVNETGGNTFFNYGTGSFTFDKFEVDTDEDEHTISFDVNLGNPLTASSAFRLTVDTLVDANGIDFGGDTDATVCYESRDANDNFIESGCSQISELTDQFSFDVAQEWDAKIERVDQIDFSRLYDGSAVNSDTLKFTLNNDESLLAAIMGADANITISGDFTGVADATLVDANFGASALTNAPAVNGDEDEIAFIIPNADILAEGANTSTLVSGFVRFEADGITIIPQTGLITAEAEFSNGVDDATEITDAAGEWALDATVINVPYLPLLFTDTSSSVHIANDGNDAANVMATIVTFGEMGDADQTRSESVDFGDVPANTIVKLTQGTIATAFGITDASKVSITFNIDGYAQDISAYATVQNNGGRTEVSNSQAKVDGKG